MFAASKIQVRNCLIFYEKFFENSVRETSFDFLYLTGTLLILTAILVFEILFLFLNENFTLSTCSFARAYFMQLVEYLIQNM